MPQHPTEETMNITRKFLGGEVGTPGQPPGGNQGQQLPAQAAPIAGQQAFGQRSSAMRRPPAGVRRPVPRRPLSVPQPDASLSDRYFGLPGPVDYARTPQGQSLMQRVLGARGGLR